MGAATLSIMIFIVVFPAIMVTVTLEITVRRPGAGLRMVVLVAEPGAAAGLYARGPRGSATPAAWGPLLPAGMSTLEVIITVDVGVVVAREIWSVVVWT